MATFKMDKTICGNVNKVTTHSDGETTRVIIETTCAKIKNWGTEFDVPMENLMNFHDTIFAEKSKTGTLTPTCFVPVLIANAIWLENGMIAKNLVKKITPLQVDFVDE
jgi:hypothetical protein